MDKTIYAVQRHRPNGEEYWVDNATGQEVAAPYKGTNLAEVQRSANLRRMELTEPSKRPLTKEQERVKENAKLLNLSEAEAEIFARGRK